MRKRWHAFCGAVALAAAAASHADSSWAQSWPAKPVRYVIPFDAGASPDIVGRTITDRLTRLWGQQVVVENRVGAAGTLGSAYVAKAPPDGYTLLINSNAHCVNPAIYAKLPYDTLKDFTEIAPLAIQPNGSILVGMERLATRNIPEITRLTPGGQLDASFGSGGIVGLPFGNTSSRVLAIQPDGRIVGVLEDIETHSRGVVFRLLADG